MRASGLPNHSFTTPMNEPPLIQRRWVQGTLLVGFWTLVALIFITRNTILQLVGPQGVALDQPFTIGRAIWTLLAWYVWIPSTLVAVWLVRRFPLDRGNRIRNAIIHMGAAPCLSLLAATGFTALRGLPRIVEGASFIGWYPEALVRIYTGAVAIDSFIYLSILVAVHAFEYYRKYREQEIRATQLEAELAEAQLHALKLQLHPHFLFNTFHAISILMRQHKHEDAMDTIAVLSNFLRYVLDNTGAQEVALQQELDFLESYLAIEQIRFGSNLTVETDVGADAQQAQVPNLILQPLVENAIRHGIGPSERPGHIEVTARREGDQLRLQVRDNGVGLPEDWHFETDKGIGLSNTKARLERLYDAEYRLDLTAPPDQPGLLVTIVIPYRRSEETVPRELSPSLAGASPLHR